MYVLLKYFSKSLVCLTFLGTSHKWSCSKMDFKHKTATMSISKGNLSVFWKYRKQIITIKEAIFINAYFNL